MSDENNINSFEEKDDITEGIEEVRNGSIEGTFISNEDRENAEKGIAELEESNKGKFNDDNLESLKQQFGDENYGEDINFDDDDFEEIGGLNTKDFNSSESDPREHLDKLVEEQQKKNNPELTSPSSVSDPSPENTDLTNAKETIDHLAKLEEITKEIDEKTNKDKTNLLSSR